MTSTSAGRENLDADHVSRYDSEENAGAAAEVRFLTSLGLTPESSMTSRCLTHLRAEGVPGAGTAKATGCGRTGWPPT